MSSRICLLIAVVVAVTAPLQAQETDSASTGLKERTATVLAGGGTSFGWYGANGSIYVLDRRWSVHVGLGYATAPAEGHPTGAAWAAGIRRYTAGPRKQWFVGLLYGLLVTVSDGTVDPSSRMVTYVWEWGYGPAVTGGWQYTAGSGFTFLASLGVGLPLGTGGPSVVPGLDIGLGYTW